MRQSAKAALLAYITNYELKKKLANVLDFFVGQLGYELESGRLMAADCLRAIFNTCKAARLRPHAIYLFLSLAPHLANDESKECRQQVAAAVAALLLNTEPETRDSLRKPVLIWYRSTDNPAHVRLACHLLSVWVDTLGLAALRADMAAILQQLPGYLGSCEAAAEADGLTIQALGLLLRLARSEPDLLMQPAGRAALWERVHAALLHSHAWVRLQAAQLLGRRTAAANAKQGSFITRTSN
jgi:U3 small nucleolar RNA-associated protein 20